MKRKQKLNDPSIWAEKSIGTRFGYFVSILVYPTMGFAILVWLFISFYEHNLLYSIPGIVGLIAIVIRSINDVRAMKALLEKNRLIEKKASA